MWCARGLWTKVGTCGPPYLSYFRERRVTSHGWRRRFLERGASVAGENVDGRQLRLPRRPTDVDGRRPTVAGHEWFGGRRPADQRRPDTVFLDPALRPRHFYTSATAAAAVAVFVRLSQQRYMTSVIFLLTLAPSSATPTHLTSITIGDRVARFV